MLSRCKQTPPTISPGLYVLGFTRARCDKALLMDRTFCVSKNAARAAIFKACFRPIFSSVVMALRALQSSSSSRLAIVLPFVPKTHCLGEKPLLLRREFRASLTAPAASCTSRSPTPWCLQTFRQTSFHDCPNLSAIPFCQ